MSAPIKQRPSYEGLDRHGLPNVRPAERMSELPWADRSEALEAATQEVAKLLGLPAQRKISYGVPVHVAFGLTRSQAKVSNQAALLLTMGCDLHLDHCPQFNGK